MPLLRCGGERLLKALLPECGGKAAGSSVALSAGGRADELLEDLTGRRISGRPHEIACFAIDCLPERGEKVCFVLLLAVSIGFGLVLTWFG